MILLFSLVIVVSSLEDLIVVWTFRPLSEFFLRVMIKVSYLSNVSSGCVRLIKGISGISSFFLTINAFFLRGLD